MAIAIHRDSETARLVEEPFNDEAELQAYLERSPYLLMKGSEPEVATVQTEVGLPAAGRLDLLVVDKEGVPVAVEVKLARNAQSRRDVVAQAFDYVADLSNLTFEELYDIVDGALSAMQRGCYSTSSRRLSASHLGPDVPARPQPEARSAQSVGWWRALFTISSNRIRNIPTVPPPMQT